MIVFANVSVIGIVIVIAVIVVSRVTEEGMDVGELVEYGFDEKSSVRSIRMYIVSLDGVDGDREHHELA